MFSCGEHRSCRVGDRRRREHLEHGRREQEDQGHGDHERRERHEHEDEHRDDVVDDALAAERADHAEEDRERGGDQRHEHHHEDGVLDASRDDRVDRALRGKGLPPVQRHHVAEPVPVLRERGLGEVELLAQQRQRPRSRLATQQRPGSIAGQELGRQEDEDRREPDDEHADCKPSCDQGYHRSLPLISCIGPIGVLVGDLRERDLLIPVLPEAPPRREVGGESRELRVVGVDGLAERVDDVPAPVVEDLLDLPAASRCGTPCSCPSAPR